MKTTKIAEILKSIKFEDDDLKKMVENIISATKLPPYMLGFNFTKKGKTRVGGQNPPLTPPKRGIKKSANIVYRSNRHNEPRRMD